MAGLLPRRRTRQEIERADTAFLRKHDEYFEAWLRKAEQSEKKQKQTEPRKMPTHKTEKAGR